MLWNWLNIYISTLSKRLCPDLPAKQSLLFGVFVSESVTHWSHSDWLQQSVAEQLWSLANYSSVGESASCQPKVGVGLCVSIWGCLLSGLWVQSKLKLPSPCTVRVLSWSVDTIGFNKTSISTAWVNLPVFFHTTDRGTSKLVEMDTDCTNRILALRSDRSFPVAQSKITNHSTRLWCLNPR